MHSFAHISMPLFVYKYDSLTNISHIFKDHNLQKQQIMV